MACEKINHSEEALLPVEQVPTSWREKPLKRRSTWAILLTCSNVIIFLLSIILCVKSQHGVQESWLRQTSYYSPLWGTPLEKQLKKADKLFDGSLFQTPNPSKYRNGLHPTKEVDDAWQQLEWIRTFPITAADVRKLGKDPDLAVKFPPQYGFGDDAYVAQLDIFHQLHCLNLLRHIAWGEYDRDGKTPKRPYSDLHWIHVAHCTEVLRENLLCSANLDVITFNWKETQDLPFADFDINKRCTKDAEEMLMEWQERNTVVAERARNFTRPEGAREVPIGEEYFRIFGVERVDLHPGEAHEHAYKKGAE
ncbi:hypothetical protein GE09DRAFT_1183362 [Coniochaeta sp. 2T2.1]|nr:hypothetical protein GE09DRAFT_1183362 [Coniochaeta sp. 2T2.1]